MRHVDVFDEVRNLALLNKRIQSKLKLAARNKPISCFRCKTRHECNTFLCIAERVPRCTQLNCCTPSQLQEWCVSQPSRTWKSKSSSSLCSKLRFRVGHEMIKLEARSDGGKIYLISLIYLTAPIRLDSSGWLRFLPLSRAQKSRTRKVKSTVLSLYCISWSCWQQLARTRWTRSLIQKELLN